MKKFAQDQDADRQREGDLRQDDPPETVNQADPADEDVERQDRDGGGKEQAEGEKRCDQSRPRNGIRAKTNAAELARPARETSSRTSRAGYCTAAARSTHCKNDRCNSDTESDWETKRDGEQSWPCSLNPPSTAVRERNQTKIAATSRQTMYRQHAGNRAPPVLGFRSDCGHRLHGQPLPQLPTWRSRDASPIPGRAARIRSRSRRSPPTQPRRIRAGNRWNPNLYM